VAGTTTWTIALELPAGPGRIGAALSVTWQSILTVLITAALLALLGFFDGSDRSRLHTVAIQLAPPRIAFPNVYRRSC
jgi:hypothetical protein